MGRTGGFAFQMSQVCSLCVYNRMSGWKMDHRVEVELMIEYPRTPQLVFSSFPPGRPALISGWLCIPDELSLLSVCVQPHERVENGSPSGG